MRPKLKLLLCHIQNAFHKVVHIARLIMHQPASPQAPNPTRPQAPKQASMASRWTDVCLTGSCTGWLSKLLQLMVMILVSKATVWLPVSNMIPSHSNVLSREGALALGMTQIGCSCFKLPHSRSAAMWRFGRKELTFQSKYTSHVQHAMATSFVAISNCIFARGLKNQA